MPKIFKNYTPSKYVENQSVGYIDTETAKERFLELFVQTAHFHRTCQILGLVPRTVYHWIHYDEEFKEEYEIAKGLGGILLEDEAVRRAIYGVDEPVYQGGKFVGYVRRYSDMLLVTLLKGNMPEKYRENWKGTLTDGSGNPLAGNKITINHIHTEAKQLATSEEEIEIEIKERERASGGTEDISFELLPPAETPEGASALSQQVPKQPSSDPDPLEHAE